MVKIADIIPVKNPMKHIIIKLELSITKPTAAIVIVLLKPTKSPACINVLRWVASLTQ